MAAIILFEPDLRNYVWELIDKIDTDHFDASLHPSFREFCTFVLQSFHEYYGEQLMYVLKEKAHITSTLKAYKPRHRYRLRQKRGKYRTGKFDQEMYITSLKQLQKLYDESGWYKNIFRDRYTYLLNICSELLTPLWIELFGEITSADLE